MDECYAHNSPIIPTAAHVRYSLRQLFRGQRLKGTIKFFNHQRGSGYIRPDDGGKDISVHKRDVNKSDLRQMSPGQQVEFDKEKGRYGRPEAQNVRLPTPDVCGLASCPYDSHQKPSPLNSLNDVDIRDFRHQTLGMSGSNDKEGAKIGASHLYKMDNQWQMRIWGYIPAFSLPPVIYKNSTGTAAIKRFLMDTFQDEKFWRHCFGLRVTFAKKPVVKQWHHAMDCKDFISDLIQST